MPKNKIFGSFRRRGGIENLRQMTTLVSGKSALARAGSAQVAATRNSIVVSGKVSKA
jgi:hypothetical protein